MQKPIVYLAGPDVFLKNAQGILLFKKGLLTKLGYDVLMPLDVISTDAQEIYEQNADRMRKCDIILANVTPFRGTEPDSGTVFEIGFGVALGKEVITYNNPKTPYGTRVGEYLLWDGKQNEPWDIESFGLKQNLMLSCSVKEFQTFADALEHLSTRASSSAG